MMHRGETIDQCWSRLHQVKQTVINRCERYAALTLPRVMLPEGTNLNDTDQTHDFQSIGAVAVNHVVNKLAVAMFSPAKPFFKIGVGQKTKQELAAAQMKQDDLKNIFATIEREACEQLDQLGQRPVLYAALRHLVILGNVLLHFDNEQVRLFSLKHFCVKRNRKGKVHTIVVKETVKFDELEEDVQALLNGRYTPDSDVCHYTVIYRVMIQGKAHYVQKMAVDAVELQDPKYQGRWLEADCPWRVLTWDLADEADYGTGLVEEYSGDLEALSMLAESTVTGGVLGAEFRYLLNPSMQTSVEDWNRSKNGDAMAGVEGDIAVVSGGNPESLKIAFEISGAYEKRVSRAFLLNSAVTRDAERVTAEEIRMTAMELETAFGGVYTALAANFQSPVAHWLLDRVDTKVKGTDLKVVVITGLDAISRNGELENFRQAVGDLAAFATIPPIVLARFKFDEVAKFVGARRGVDFSTFLKTDDEMAQEQANAAAMQAQAAGQEAGAVAAGEQAGNPEGNS